MLQQSAGNAAVTRLLQRQEVTFDLEVPTPEEQERLRRQGVELPRVSAASADPRRHSDYVDRRLTAVGFGIYLGGYVLYLEDVAEPLFVPESHFDFTATNVAPADLAIHPSWDAAIGVVPQGPHRPGDEIPYAYYRGARGVIAPTLFTPATTPRVINTALQARRELGEYVQQQMVVLAISIVGGMALRAIIRRLVNIGRGPRAPARPPAEIGEELIRRHGGCERRSAS
jgi:hypothetical protein